MARLRNIVDRALANPLATLVGVIVVPALHLALRANKLKSASFIAWVQERTTPTRTDITAARSMATGVTLGARLWGLQETSCVARSLTCWALCARAGIRADIKIGMDAHTRTAHAWVEVDGTPVDDTADVAERYLPFDGTLTGETPTGETQPGADE